jgi:hypothetical protein
MLFQSPQHYCFLHLFGAVHIFFFLKRLEFELRASHLNHTSSPFCSGYFGSEVSQTVCPSWSQITILPISASQVARFTGMSHWHPAITVQIFFTVHCLLPHFFPFSLTFLPIISLRTSFNEDQ